MEPWKSGGTLGKVIERKTMRPYASTPCLTSEMVQIAPVESVFRSTKLPVVPLGPETYLGIYWRSYFLNESHSLFPPKTSLLFHCVDPCKDNNSPARTPAQSNDQAYMFVAKPSTPCPPHCRGPRCTRIPTILESIRTTPNQ